MQVFGRRSQTHADGLMTSSDATTFGTWMLVQGEHCLRRLSRLRLLLALIRWKDVVKFEMLTKRAHWLTVCVHLMDG